MYEQEDIAILLAKVLAGEASAKEEARLNAWRKEHPLEYEEYHKSWQAATGKTEPLLVNTDEAWKRVSERIGLADLDEVGPAAEGITGKARPINWLRYAAVLAIGLSVGLLLTQPWKSDTISLVSITAKEKEQIQLADGSQVSLAASSTLQYPEAFSEDERRIQLQGKAFFEVSHNANKPFIIEAGEAEVMVLGTSFGVSTEEGEVEVNVTSGSVALINEKTEERVVLTKGERGILHKSGKLDHYQRQEVNALSWQTGRLRFQDSPLDSVVLVLARHYQVPIRMAPELGSCRWTAKFNKQRLEVVLESMKLAFGVNIAQKPDSISISGTGCAPKL